MFRPVNHSLETRGKLSSQEITELGFESKQPSFKTRSLYTQAFQGKRSLGHFQFLFPIFKQRNYGIFICFIGVLYLNVYYIALVTCTNVVMYPNKREVWLPATRKARFMGRVLVQKESGFIQVLHSRGE